MDLPAKCQVLSNEDAFGYLVQGALALLCFVALLIKRWMEKPRRRWTIFMMDTSKQGFGGGTLHIMNMIMATFLVSLNPNADECDWYFINVLMDSTIGVLFCYLLVCVFQPIIIHFGANAFGNYGMPPKFSTWLFQTVVWMIICVLSKAINGASMVFLSTPVAKITEWLFLPLSDFPKTKLVLVMVIIPSILNAVQFWISDNFLKGSTNLPLQEEFEMQTLRASLTEYATTPNRRSLHTSFVGSEPELLAMQEARRFGAAVKEEEPASEYSTSVSC
eukprot:GDKJ01058185.1.p1 GENE.GDKJ01058185.1~~GDKJ01058185.1.p1  ORF type:complete len:284 (+),score=15.64 GDKJ01058185.1:25-852(+)